MCALEERGTLTLVHRETGEGQGRGQEKLDLGWARAVHVLRHRYIRLDKQKGRNKETGVERGHPSGGEGKKNVYTVTGNRVNTAKTGSLNQAPPWGGTLIPSQVYLILLV